MAFAEDYIDVPTRIAEFREKYPEGSLRPLDPAAPFRVEHVAGMDRSGTEVRQTFIVYSAAAYRTPSDPCPGIGSAWEIWPGRTPYTRDSELQNAETSAWGRAIVAALAADTRKGIASAEEVRNRQAERTPPQRPQPAPQREESADSQECFDHLSSRVDESTTTGELDELEETARTRFKDGTLSTTLANRLKKAIDQARAAIHAADRDAS